MAVVSLSKLIIAILLIVLIITLFYRFNKIIPQKEKSSISVEIVERKWLKKTIITSSIVTIIFGIICALVFFGLGLMGLAFASGMSGIHTSDQSNLGRLLLLTCLIIGILVICPVLAILATNKKNYLMAIVLSAFPLMGLCWTLVLIGRDGFIGFFEVVGQLVNQ